MWKAPVLLWVLGSTWLWVPAQGAAMAGPEDVTQGAEGGAVTPGIEDLATTGATEDPSGSTGGTALVPEKDARTTQIPIEDLSTPESSDHTHPEHLSTAAPTMATSHSVDKNTSHPDRDKGPEETAEEKDSLAIVTLVGIIVGVLLAIAFIGGIIIVIMRKTSGRFSP